MVLPSNGGHFYCLACRMLSCTLKTKIWLHDYQISAKKNTIYSFYPVFKEQTVCWIQATGWYRYSGRWGYIRLDLYTLLVDSDNQCCGSGLFWSPGSGSGSFIHIKTPCYSNLLVIKLSKTQFRPNNFLSLILSVIWCLDFVRKCH